MEDPDSAGHTLSSDRSAVDPAVDEVTVLVTGFGPFTDDWPVNPSFLIADSLPPLLHPNPGHPTPIRILVHPTPVRVAYSAVRELVPKLYPTDSKIDLVLHIGMAGGRDHYSMERVGHRDGYDKNRDVDGRTLAADDGAQYWPECPATLATSVACEDVWRRCRAQLADQSIDVRPSHDAGHFLCDFIYYSSLAHFYRRGEGGKDGERPVMFLHVPGDSDAQAVARGRQVAEALVRALVESRRAQKGGSGSAA
ncbi:hypothetical protein BJ546DRAFT_841468 [Cryomyces antarcticus]|uniref:Peptidase C15, pyroglutamyl peptidase I-like protein n=1 Tax=Cryomyces antarcticus TaxID=329879 RepID=A0ABR0LNT3_9PEZI|nr:hypothetical protein LTR16_003436 [Cryomyces antarcticus]